MNKQPQQTAVPMAETEFPVRYAETDAMGMVHHSAYLVYFEEARSHFMRQLGRDYAEIEADGLRLPVTETQLRYSGSLFYGQRARVRLWLEENRSRSLKFRYEVYAAGDDTLKVSGHTCHIWTDATGKVTRIPDSLKQLFGSS